MKPLPGWAVEILKTGRMGPYEVTGRVGGQGSNLNAAIGEVFIEGGALFAAAVRNPFTIKAQLQSLLVEVVCSSLLMVEKDADLEPDATVLSEHAEEIATASRSLVCLVGQISVFLSQFLRSQLSPAGEKSHDLLDLLEYLLAAILFEKAAGQGLKPGRVQES